MKHVLGTWAVRAAQLQLRLQRRDDRPHGQQVGQLDYGKDVAQASTRDSSGCTSVHSKLLNFTEDDTTNAPSAPIFCKILKHLMWFTHAR